MEKKYLELKLNGRIVGVFEDVKVFEDRGDQGLYVESEDGNYEIPVTDNSCGWHFKQLHMIFDSYNLCGRRSLKRHTNNLRQGSIN